MFEAKLRQKLDSTRKEVGAQMNNLISDLLGVDPRDVLTDAEIKKHLTTAFNKFDKDGSGEMGTWEFTQAWLFLGLKGSEDEIQDAFNGVDKNNSGLIDLDEFVTAIKSERLLELNLTRVFDKLGVKYATSAEKYEAFKQKAARRRLLAKQIQDKTEQMVKSITDQLATFAGVKLQEKDARDQKTYDTLKDTFNAFDKDGSGEMGYEEYNESWKFLNRP